MPKRERIYKKRLGDQQNFSISSVPSSLPPLLCVKQTDKLYNKHNHQIYKNDLK